MSSIALLRKKGVQNRRFWSSLARDARRIAGIASRTCRRVPRPSEAKYNDLLRVDMSSIVVYRIAEEFRYLPCVIPDKSGAFVRYLNGKGAQARRRRTSPVVSASRKQFLYRCLLFYWASGGAFAYRPADDGLPF